MPKPLPELIIWGGTGNFKVLCELLRDEYRIAGYFDNNPAIPKAYGDIPCLGNREAFGVWVRQYEHREKPAFIVSIGPGYGPVRLEIHEMLLQHGLQPIRAVHRTAFVAASAQIGEGSQVYAQAAVCVDAVLGRACIVNTAASVDHECVLGDGVTVGPGARLAGMVTVGKNADIYTGAVVLPRVRIGEGAVVGAGAVVLKDVPDGAVVVGNPARLLKQKN
ncbi:MAG: NeuD/PglB/VioB family sugar acetyltransferase [Saprospiraceae bacterium]|nr:NeuD/PglB/VioB family sugar acetyltransferase [Saprospiraceae bacterium]